MNYNKAPFIEIDGEYTCISGWEDICRLLNNEIGNSNKSTFILAVETYQGVLREDIEAALKEYLTFSDIIHTESCMLSEKEIYTKIYPDLTDDRIFGYLTRLNLSDYFDREKVESVKTNIKYQEGIKVILGPGASYITEKPDLLIYADMARWEIQMRMRRHEVDNLGFQNRKTEDWMLLYKHGFFVDWRILDRYKKTLFDKIDYILDTNNRKIPKLISNQAILEAYKKAISRPFCVVPFFDPGPWGGQWMKEVCDLDRKEENYAWCFNCVPEENSLLIKYNEQIIELPAINLVFRYPEQLLGSPVHARFGDEFPIRFDFLDTMDGGNLSLQVHPLTEYIQEKFGMHYTQDESYYLMDARPGAVVYLGLKDEVNPDKMIGELMEAQSGKSSFEAEKYVQTWPAKKHDHFLIPGGTVHCSGKDSMVLEISATPYIFTFKLWDWGRLGMDGKPRPININHGRNVIQWNRTRSWTKDNLINRIEKVAEGEGWKEEKTGLHVREFIETRRHWFTRKTEHDTAGSVNVVCLVEGDKVIVESPDDSFETFEIHYAEVFIVPANVGKYTIRPAIEEMDSKCATVKAFVRF